MVTIAERLKEAMALRGYRQADLIEKTGINKGALSCYISGKYKPKQNNIYLLAKALDVSEAWLMGADVPMERPAQYPPYQDYDEYVEEMRLDEQWKYEYFISTMKKVYNQLTFEGQNHLIQTALDMTQIERFRKGTTSQKGKEIS
jgi:transcriptional regulator with XRE-family HTH domain